jgi:cell wall-associated NlpC family hydrolase
MAPLTTDDVRGWDVAAIHSAFDVATDRGTTIHRLGEHLREVEDNLSDWHGAGGEAFRQELGKVRADLDEHGQESARVAAAISRSEKDIAAVKTSLQDIDATARTNGWKVTSDWKLDFCNTGQGRGNDPQFANAVRTMQQDLNNVKLRAETADQELATALRAAVGEVKLDVNGFPIPQEPPPPTPNTVPGPNAQDPPYETGLDPTLAGDPHDQPPMQVSPGSSAQVRLTDNPPGYNGPAGPERDEAWLDFLSQSDGTTRGTVNPGVLLLPNPDAVSDPRLKTVGAAAKQQGVSYTWGGGHDPKAPGVSVGHLNGSEDQSWTYHDNNRTGFDCSGLARFATAEGSGVDIGSGNTVSQEQVLRGLGIDPIPNSALQPGDLIYYGPPGDSTHVAVYAGNGLMIQAEGSGIPVEVSPLRLGDNRNYHVGG